MDEKDRELTSEEHSRLLKFEALYAHVVDGQGPLSEQLEALRLAGKMKSYQFRELMSQKLTNSMIITLFERFGLR